VFYKLTHFLPEITVITKATACIPETFLGIRLSTIEEDKLLETEDMFEKDLKKENMIC
jgi:hypothetical protein